MSTNGSTAMLVSVTGACIGAATTFAASAASSDKGSACVAVVSAGDRAPGRSLSSAIAAMAMTNSTMMATLSL